MSKPISGNAKRVFSLRLPKEVVFASRDIPNFRGRLEVLAVDIHLSWLRDKERGV